MKIRNKKVATPLGPSKLHSVFAQHNDNDNDNDNDNHHHHHKDNNNNDEDNRNTGTKPKSTSSSSSSSFKPPNAKKNAPTISQTQTRKAQTDILHRQALQQDPNIFDYDSFYDQKTATTNSKSSNHASKKTKTPNNSINHSPPTQKKSKYIEDLLETAAKRKIANDIAFERKQHNELKKDAHLYEDKEQFITSSYKKKLIEHEKWQEENKKKEDAEKDVTKSADLSPFYYNLLTNNVAFGTKRERERESEEKQQSSSQQQQQQQQTPKPSTSDERSKLHDIQIAREIYTAHKKRKMGEEKQRTKEGE